ncbi:MAG: alpha/beta fold hydrolase [Pseudomonadota bacterium]
MTDILSERILDHPTLGIEHAGSGEFLIFLHGIGGNRTNWAEQLGFFAPSYHAVAWDARGYGLSDDYDGPLDFSMFSHDLLRVLDHFNVEKAHICGLSMGGLIAQDFYALYPDRVKSLALVATFTGFDHLTREERQRFVDLRRKPLIDEGKEPRDIALNVAQVLAGPDASDEAMAKLIESMAALHKESYVKTIEAMAHYKRRLDLSKIAVPCALIFAENDSLATPAIGSDMARAIPGAAYIEFPRTGHLINIEKPDLFNETLGAFLSSVQSG